MRRHKGNFQRLQRAAGTDAEKDALLAELQAAIDKIKRYVELKPLEIRTPTNSQLGVSGMPRMPIRDSAEKLND